MSETIPQYPWHEGDHLYASALNAAFANGAAIGGPYLVLAGGTMNGPISIPEVQNTAPVPPVPSISLTRDQNYSTSDELAHPQLYISNNMYGDAFHEGPAGSLYPLEIRFHDNALRNLASSIGGSQDCAITTQIFRDPMSGGVPNGRRMRDLFSFWNAMNDGTNTPSSQGGNIVVVEHDLWFNHVDDQGGRLFFQINCAPSIPFASGGYPLSFATAMYIQGGQYVSGHDLILLGSAFSHSALNMFYTGSGAPIVTSATPGGPTRSITVDHILPLESGGSSGGSDFPVSSTYAYIRSVTDDLVAGTALEVNDASYLVVGMFVYDTTAISAVADLTRITAISGSTITLSGNVTLASGSTVVFSQARKAVTINGNQYTVAGVHFTGPGSDAGTVYFTSAVPVSDASHGAVIYPNAHAIWLPNGSDTAPWQDICFDAYGTATIRSDGGTGIRMTGSGLTLSGTGELAFGSNSAIFWNPTALGGSRGAVDVLSPLVVGGTLYTAADLIVAGPGTINGALGLEAGFGVYGSVAPSAQPVVTGSKGGNTALASLLSALRSYGLINDSTS